MKHIIKGKFSEIKTEDGGCAKICEVIDDTSTSWDEDGQAHMFLRFHSFHEFPESIKSDEELKAWHPKHEEFNALVKEGRKVKITIEVED
jgi:hypothetical protein